MPPPAPTAYAAAPGAPGGPGYGTTAGAPPPAGGYNKSGKNRTIALIVGGVVAVGVLGGLVGMLLGGGDDSKVETTASAPQGSGVLDPAPVDSTDPAPTDPSTGATEEPTPDPSPTEEPTPEPDTDPAPAPSGDAVVLGGNVTVPVPTGWKVFGSDDTSIAMGKDSDFVYAVVGTVEPSSDAGQVLINSLETVLPSEQYPDLETSDVQPQQPGGSIVSLALLEYEATWTDGQGSLPVHGAVFSAIRQDGTALIILGEHSPPKQFMDAWPTLKAVIDPVLLGFAGLG